MEIEGWILDAYPGRTGEMVVWLKKSDGATVRLADTWWNAIYVSTDRREGLERIAEWAEHQLMVYSVDFVQKREHVFDYGEREVLKLILRNGNDVEKLAKEVESLDIDDEIRIYNADLLPAQVYFIEKDLFPLAKVKAEQVGDKIRWQLEDSVMAEDYQLPALKKVVLKVVVYTAGRIAKFNDPIGKIILTTLENSIEISEGSERDKLLSLVNVVNDLDSDILFVERGDDFTTHYLAERAYLNGVADQLILGRDPVPVKRLKNRGTSYFAYGRVLRTPTSHKLSGRINLDAENFFVYSECGLDGLFEVVRLCRMPLHKGSRASIGKCLSSLQAYIAFKENLLIPWKPTRVEVPKSGKTLLLGDRGGFIYEPKVGVHESVGEIDFTSLYPFIMKNHNISAETVLCGCCHDSKIGVPGVDYNICERRIGVIPRSLEPILIKRVSYKRKKEAENPQLRKVYEARVNALKGILVCSFGYLSYRNAKFGLIDCHISVCAFARKILLDTMRIVERRGFEMVHGIVDSLWVKKRGATKEDYLELCQEIEREIGMPISFEGIYMWVAFLSSRMHDDVPVLNRYFGVFEDGTVKVRGIEMRRRDTIKLVSDCQNEILSLLSSGTTIDEVKQLLPQAVEIVRRYVEFIDSGKIPLSDLTIVNGLSKNFNEYKSNQVHIGAIKQLAEEGLELMAGQSVSYVVTNYRSQVPEERVRPVELLDDSVTYDKKRYAEILMRGMGTLLEPFGIDGESLTRTAMSVSKAKQESVFLVGG